MGRNTSGSTGVVGVPVTVLRAAVERQLSAASLRAVPLEIGMSPNALRNFVRGAAPRRTTRVRLERWLAARPASERGPSVSEFVRLVAEVTPDLSEGEAEILGRRVSELLLDAYQRRRLSPPPMGARAVATLSGLICCFAVDTLG
jgi:hypothetical protein